MQWLNQWQSKWLWAAGRKGREQIHLHQQEVSSYTSPSDAEGTEVDE